MGLVLRTQTDVAELLGVHRRTLQEWLARGCPGRRGHYDLGRIAEWHSNVILGVCHCCRRPLPKDSRLRDPRFGNEDD